MRNKADVYDVGIIRFKTEEDYKNNNKPSWDKPLKVCTEMTSKLIGWIKEDAESERYSLLIEEDDNSYAFKNESNGRVLVYVFDKTGELDHVIS